MRRLVPLALIAALLLFLIWLLDSLQGDLLNSQNSSQRGGDFSLQSINGPVSLSDFKGKVVLLYFGYTWCPDICPTNLALMSAAFSEMDPEQLKHVQGIFISVDPNRDGVERLSEYTNFFHENIMGITGSEAEIAELAARYGVAYRLFNQDSATDYVVDHSSETYVIDTSGQWVDSLPHAAPPEDITKAILANFSADSLSK